MMGSVSLPPHPSNDAITLFLQVIDVVTNIEKHRALIDEFITRPFMQVFRICDGLERRWTDFLSGTESRESDRVPAAVPEPAGDELA